MFTLTAIARTHEDIVNVIIDGRLGNRFTMPGKLSGKTKNSALDS